MNFGPKLNFGQKIEFRTLMWISDFYNFGPPVIRSVRLSNYGSDRGPDRHGPKFKRVGPARNSNNTDLFGLESDRAARMYTYTHSKGDCGGMCSCGGCAIAEASGAVATGGGAARPLPPGTVCVCLFRLFAASGHQKLLRTAKHSAFQTASIKFVWVKPFKININI
jgi:hypothetical protein